MGRWARVVKHCGTECRPLISVVFHSLYAQLTSELKQIEAVRAAQEPVVRRLEAETEQLSAQIAALNKEQALLQAQVRTLKQAGTELSDKVQDTCHHRMGLHEPWTLKAEP